MQNREITIYHSPDADDAFMFYGLTSGAILEPGYTFKHELCDIETLNQRTLRGELDVTAVSVHAYAYIQKDYAVMRCGASMGGEHYGPLIVANRALDFKSLNGKKIAIPGQYTSATLSLRLAMRDLGIEAELVNCNFDEVQHKVAASEVDAGVIIHEGQLTHAKMGLAPVLDLGAWWWERYKLPLPLGVNVARRALGAADIAASSRALKGSIQYSLANREQALDYALSYGRGLAKSDADRFVGMYVNDYTVDLGDDGMKSIQLFLELGAEYGFSPRVGAIDFV